MLDNNNTNSSTGIIDYGNYSKQLIREREELLAKYSNNQSRRTKTEVKPKPVQNERVVQQPIKKEQPKPKVEVKKTQPKVEVKPVVKEQPKKVVNKRPIKKRRRKNLKINSTAKGLFVFAVIGLSGFVLWQTYGKSFYNKLKADQKLKATIGTESESEVIETSEIISIEPESEMKEFTPAVEEELPEDAEVLSSELFGSYDFKSNITPETLKMANPPLSSNMGYLEIPGTGIEYLVVHPDPDNIDKVEGLRKQADVSEYDEMGFVNHYYLKHTTDNTVSDWGAIYVDARNEQLNQHTCELDDITRIYGHQMRDGSQFTALKRFKDPNYSKDHDMGVYYTDDGLCYKMDFIATYVISGEDDSVIPFNFNTVEEKQAYVDNAIIQAAKSGYSNTDYADIDEDSKLLALITCSYEQRNNRQVVLYKLTKCRIRDLDYTDQGYYDIAEYERLMNKKGR